MGLGMLQPMHLLLLGFFLCLPVLIGIALVAFFVIRNQRTRK
jgi:preprotein translocase subunit YajC